MCRVDTCITNFSKKNLRIRNHTIRTLSGTETIIKYDNYRHKLLICFFFHSSHYTYNNFKCK